MVDVIVSLRRAYGRGLGCGLETVRYRRSFRSAGSDGFGMTRREKAMNSKTLNSDSVLRCCLHGLPEAPETVLVVRVTVCPFPVGLARHAVLSFMKEWSD